MALNITLDCPMLVTAEDGITRPNPNWQACSGAGTGDLQAPYAAYGMPAVPAASGTFDVGSPGIFGGPSFLGLPWWVWALVLILAFMGEWLLAALALGLLLFAGPLLSQAMSVPWWVWALLAAILLIAVRGISR